MGEPQIQSGHGGEEKKSHQRPYRELNSGHPARILVFTVTELPRLRIYNPMHIIAFLIKIHLQYMGIKNNERFRTMKNAFVENVCVCVCVCVCTMVDQKFPNWHPGARTANGTDLLY
jgi:hypothetical protein